MHLQAVDVRLAEASAPGFDADQLESLSRSIEAKKQKLEADIDAYIRKKQRELAQYEQDLLAQYREMECGQIQTSANAAASSSSSPSPSSSAVQAVQSPAESPLPAIPERTEEKEKRTKHTRAHKREKELFGLTTIFLPLLEATEPAPLPTKKENRKNHTGMDPRTPDLHPITTEHGEGSPAQGADQCKERRSRSNKKGGEKTQEKKVEHADISYGDAAKDKRRAESVKKAKRPAMKKSNLKHGGDKSRRKRVSLVIDDQIVLPADQIPEPVPTSPSDANASLSSSTTSLDEAIDPRLILDHPREYGPVHHSLPHTASTPAQPSISSPTKQEPTDPTPKIPSPPLTHSPQQMTTPIPQPTPQPSHLEYEPPKTSGPTLDTPSSPSASRHIPKYASSTPIYASTASLHASAEEDFSSYVGGISGSGVDDFDQTGSLGFPSSLGASYMESYMQSRPLSVRMAAAGKSGFDDDDDEKQTRSRRRPVEDDKIDEEERSDGVRIPEPQKDIDEDMEVIGSMEDF